MNIAIDAGWAVGLVLATARVGAFVIASPIVSAVVPPLARPALVIALAAFLNQPVVDDVALGGLLAMATVNIAVGALLGFLTGLIVHLFAVAGDMVDFTSGLSAAAVLDPMTGRRAGVFSRAFEMTALVGFLALGGDRLLVQGLTLSTAIVPLNGHIVVDGAVAQVVLEGVSTMFIAALELAAPAVAALFLAEVLLGLAGRFAPQANLFLLGLPAKTLGAMLVLPLVLLAFPSSLDGILHSIHQTFAAVLGAVSPN